ncbi:helix-turn-helix domain-containing protein [Psychrobacter sp. APC 3426]|uniref:helix-turn-helix domain-containing protein n=1 Tax=Psychrobacter sp. APC 3426 TaxID=3035177 RepID=UPI0025B3425C|nr:helix-turn-helix domain-containing protein [Psychrobacter sp. APC 3426]MDN3397460.1 helix-turn-helix domain-containing protein [Psychrobacter sp. APC 3426]
MKYDIDFKIRVIAYYQQGHSAYATAKHFNIDDKDVVKWVNQYQAGGVLAIKPKTRKAIYSCDFKLQVLTTMADEGLSQSQAALKFNISSPALISAWRSSYACHGMLGLTAKAKGRLTMKHPYLTDKPDHEKSVEEIKRENEYLRAENAYLKKLDALLREKEQAATKQGSSKD